MKVLVTGGSGFIGTSLVSDLLRDDHSVSIYDKVKSAAFPGLCTAGDVRDREELTAALNGIETVYHLAAEHRDDVRPASLYYAVNVDGAKNLIYAAEKNNITKIIFTSSVAIYGLNSGKPNEESLAKPFNDYSRSKYQAEKVFDEWVKADDSRCLVIVRPVVIFGEQNQGNVFELIRQIASGKFLMVGNGKNLKSMGFVLNISRFLANLIEIAPGRHVYNYADKPDMTVEELLKITLKALGKEPVIKWRVPYSIGLLGGYAFDTLSRITGRTYPISSIRIKKFTAETKVSTKRLTKSGFTAPYSLIDGLNRMIANEFLQEP